MSYYDQSFTPWEIVDGQVVVVDESEWEQLVGINNRSYEAHRLWESTRPEKDQPNRPIVKVTTDIFGDVPQIVRSVATGKLIQIDLRKRLLRTIGSTPHVDYLMVTQRPELVREKWPTRWVRSEHEYQQDSFGNVILAVPVETQADIERLVPDLIKCRDLCKGLAVVCNPKEELDFNFKPLLEKPEGYTNFAIEYLTLIVAEGNEHPIHPAWLRSLRDQCKDASVKFNLASWGRWMPVFDHSNFISAECGDHVGHQDVGKDKSGRLLDGVEHNGVVQESKR